MTQKNPSVSPDGSSAAEATSPSDCDSRPARPALQDHDRTLLIGSVAGSKAEWPCCPWATTVVAWSNALKCDVLIAQECKRWGCTICGKKRTLHLARKTELAKPNRLITLTCWTLAYENPRAAYDGTRRALSQLVTRLRRRYAEFEYLRVLELHKNGFPHYHCVVRSPYIPQREVSDIWAELTQSPIVDVRQIKKTDRVCFYVMKYLAKQKVIPWTNRRVSWSRNFFRKDDWKPPEPLNLREKEWHDMHPSDWVTLLPARNAIKPLSNNCWMIGTELELLSHQIAAEAAKSQSSGSQQSGLEDSQQHVSGTKQPPPPQPNPTPPLPHHLQIRRARGDGEAAEWDSGGGSSPKKTFADHVREITHHNLNHTGDQP